MHKATIEAIGLPLQALVLYEDDTEYTTRIGNAGGKLYLARDSHIEDGDPKWTSSGVGRGPRALITGGNSVRLYYAVRNRTFHDLKMATSARDRTMFYINSIVYLTYAALAALRAGKFRELRILIVAMWRGYRSDLTGGPPLP
jgi:GT2 family glycosyltransferase